MNSTLLWYTARSAGLVAWALLTASVLWGLALSSKAFGKRPRPNWLLDLHRFLGGAAVIFTLVHVSTIVLDSYVHFGLVEVLVPFTGRWHPVAVAWGIAGLYLLLAVEITSLLRSRLPKRLWRATHFASFPLFVLTTIHGISAGTDGRAPAMQAVMLAATFAVAAMTLLRVRELERRAAMPRRPTRAEPVRAGVR